jgi:hypothetical protein
MLRFLEIPEDAIQGEIATMRTHSFGPTQSRQVLGP